MCAGHVVAVGLVAGVIVGFVVAVGRGVGFG